MKHNTSTPQSSLCCTAQYRYFPSLLPESHYKWHDVMDSPDHLRSSQSYISNPTSVMVQGIAALSQDLLALG